MTKKLMTAKSSTKKPASKKVKKETKSNISIVQVFTLVHNDRRQYRFSPRGDGMVTVQLRSPNRIGDVFVVPVEEARSFWTSLKQQGFYQW